MIIYEAEGKYGRARVEWMPNDTRTPFETYFFRNGEWLDVRQGSSMMDLARKRADSWADNGNPRIEKLEENWKKGIFRCY